MRQRTAYELGKANQLWVWDGEWMPSAYAWRQYDASAQKVQPRIDAAMNLKTDRL